MHQTLFNFFYPPIKFICVIGRLRMAYLCVCVIMSLSNILLISVIVGGFTMLWGFGVVSVR